MKGFIKLTGIRDASDIIYIKAAAVDQVYRTDPEVGSFLSHSRENPPVTVVNGFKVVETVEKVVELMEAIL